MGKNHAAVNDQISEVGSPRSEIRLGWRSGKKLRLSHRRTSMLPNFCPAAGLSAAINRTIRPKSSRKVSAKITLKSIHPAGQEPRHLNTPAPQQYWLVQSLRPRRPADGDHL